ncbi:HlyD family secretion protein [Pseudorhizobium tarimense]|uniref:HlyD family secretion protein n=1 Tax=Pseudorhizobium tarimense TaxID=1079109 RepID=A0ABV2H0S3_9HYPH|nr:efflux RND transporter periplasmic adaptor subunit [Pseudorhizobium tarimense]MCJ8517462.1 efflux RND transporter periplasmic adaptor subunit [Pseudorhizobium tarimense]
MREICQSCLKASFRPAVFLAGLLLCGATLSQEANAVRPDAPPVVTVARAQPRELLRRVPIAATLVPRDEVLVYPRINGYRVTELLAEAGDQVEAGEVIARLEDRTLRLELAQAEAAEARARAAVEQATSQVSSAEAGLARAQSSLERTRQLQQQGTGTQAALDEAVAAELTAQAELQSAQSGVTVAEAQLEEAQARLDVARENLGSAAITSPVAGTISARNAQVGAIASASGDPLFRIIQQGTVEARAEVIETDLALLEAGDPAVVDVAGLGPVEGEVRLIATEVDPQTRLGTLRISLNQQDGLRPGLFAGGWITVDRRQAIAVPAAAIISDAGGSYVLRVEDGTVERRAVEPGLVWQDWREVRGGLSEGDVVIARAGPFFNDGDEVRPRPMEEASAGVAVGQNEAGVE